MTATKTELELCEVDSNEFILEAGIGFTEADLRWAIQSPAQLAELLDVRLADLRLNLKRYVHETKWTTFLTPDEWIESLKRGGENE